MAEPYKCQSRRFFERMNHPGAANCECPKFDDGSCVPPRHRAEHKRRGGEYSAAWKRGERDMPRAFADRSTYE